MSALQILQGLGERVGAQDTVQMPRHSTTLLSPAVLVLAGITALASAFHAPVGSRLTSAVMPARTSTRADRMLDCRGVFSDALVHEV